jgi:hypothetical protein
LRIYGRTKINYPWSSQYILEPELALTRAKYIFESSLNSYRLLVKRWFPDLLGNLYTLNLMPVKVSGLVIDASKISNQDNILLSNPSKSSEDILFPPNYFISWFWDILPSDSQNQVDLRWGEASFSINDSSYRSVIEEKLPILRPNFSHYPFPIYISDPTVFHDIYPASTLVYSWLWDDLKKLNLVKGSYNTSYS